MGFSSSGSGVVVAADYHESHGRIRIGGAMIGEYVGAAMKRARYKLLEEDGGTFYGGIPGFDGVWANAETLEDCREVLEGPTSSASPGTCRCLPWTVSPST